MPIKLNGATSGSVELDVPAAVGSDLQLTLPATAGEIVVKDSSGRVGIGSSSPSSNLDVEAATGDATLRIHAAENNSGSEPKLILESSNDFAESAIDFKDSSGIGGAIRYNHGDNALRFLGKGINSEALRIDSSGNLGINTTSPTQKLHIVGTSNVLTKTSNGVASVLVGIDSSNDGVIKVETSNNLKLYTNSTERFRLDNTGNLLCAKTSTSFSVTGTILSTAGAIYATTVNDTCFFANRTGSNGSVFGFYRNGAAVGSISITSSSTSYNTSSDYRLKENVVDIADGITRVKQLQPKRFNFIVDPGTTVDGFLAHEAQTVVPEAVTGEKDGEEMQGIDQSKLVPLLTAALQEAITKIETLETKVAALEASS